MIQLWIIGAGGHAKVVIDAALASGRYEIAGLLDDDPSLEGATLLGYAVRGRADMESVRNLGISHAVLAVGANPIRASLVSRFEGALRWATIVHPSSYVARDVRIGEGTVLFAGSVAQPSARIGRHVIINTAASVDHDCQVGDFAHVSVGSRLGGGVVVGDFAFLGIGSSVLPGLHVGRGAILGAGGVALADIPDHATAVGVPARILG